MKKFYSLFLTLMLATAMSYAQNVGVIATPVDEVYDDNVLKIQGWVEDSWSGITTVLINSADLINMQETDWQEYQAIVMTENGSSGPMGDFSPIGVEICPIVCLKAYAIKRAWPKWNLIVQSADTWYQMPKPGGPELDSTGAVYEEVYKGTVAADHPIFGGYWGVGDEFTWTTLYDENQGDEAHIQCIDLGLSSAPVAAEATMIATNNFAVAETGSTVDGWLWTMDEVADSSYKKTVIWGVHHTYMTNTTDTFRIILQNSLAWILDHEIPNIYVPIEGLDENTFADFSLNIYPNPVSSVTTVEFELEQPMNVSLVVRDALGRSVYVQEGIYGTGTQTIRLDGSSMAPGIYTCQLVGDGRTQSEMLIIE